MRNRVRKLLARFQRWSNYNQHWFPRPDYWRHRRAIKALEREVGDLVLVVEVNRHHTEVAEAAAVQLETVEPGKTILLVEDSQRQMLTDVSISKLGQRLIYGSVATNFQLANWAARSGRRLFVSSDMVSNSVHQFEVIRQKAFRKRTRPAVVVSHIRGKGIDSWENLQDTPQVVRLFEPAAKSDSPRFFPSRVIEDCDLALPASGESIRLAVVGMTFIDLKLLEEVNELLGKLDGALEIHLVGSAGGPQLNAMNRFSNLNTSLVRTFRTPDADIRSLIHTCHGIFLPKESHFYLDEYSSSVALSLEYLRPLVAPISLLRQWGLPQQFGWEHEGHINALARLVEDPQNTATKFEAISSELRAERQSRVAQSVKFLVETFATDSN